MLLTLIIVIMKFYLLLVSMAVAAPVFDTIIVEASSDPLPRDCSEIVRNKSTVYMIKPPIAREPFFVYCDLETQGGGWTVIQRHTDDILNFTKDWKHYKNGFGNIGGDFWLGLEKIHSLTNQNVYELYIELEDFTPEKRYARYSRFAVGAESEGYPLSVLGEYEGTAGDSLIYHAGQEFSTFDKDNDDASRNCAKIHKGGWWYNHCTKSNLNGKYWKGEYSIAEEDYSGMYWSTFRDFNYSLKASKMMIKPRGVYSVPQTTGKPSWI